MDIHPTKVIKHVEWNPYFDQFIELILNKPKQYHDFLMIDKNSIMY